MPSSRHFNCRLRNPYGHSAHVDGILIRAVRKCISRGELPAVAGSKGPTPADRAGLPFAR